MKVYLVWLKNCFGVIELQVWWYDPAKMLRPNTNIVKQQEIHPAIAERLSLKELEMVYGSQPAN